MTPEGPNPTKIQSKPVGGGATQQLPLLLIHDGGGTTAGFWALGKLHREVWAMHNPNFWSGQPWTGGMDEMVACYVDLVQKSEMRGRIILGGWSLGGYLALAMSKTFATLSSSSSSSQPKPKVEVAGLLLVDSPFIPFQLQRSITFPQPRLPDFPPKVKQTLAYCDELLDTWSMPTWDGAANNGDEVCFEIDSRSYSVGPGTVVRKPLDGDWTATTTKPTSKIFPDNPFSAIVPPSAVLLRCVKYTDVIGGSTESCRVDRTRGDPVLGWEADYPSMIKAVIDVNSSHYAAFDRYDNFQINHMTTLLNQALQVLDTVTNADDI